MLTHYVDTHTHMHYFKDPPIVQMVNLPKERMFIILADSWSETNFGCSNQFSLVDILPHACRNWMEWGSLFRQ